MELYLPLITGGKVIIAPQAAVADANQLQNLIQGFHPSHLQATPATWQLLKDSGWKNETDLVIMSGGEAIKTELKEYLVKLSHQEVWNLYGPTETTIWSSVKALKQGERVSIGQPIGNTQIYVLKTTEEDPFTTNSLVPIGVIGELMIAGDGLARGYLNKKALTDKRFLPNPFEVGKRLYRTGDLARWLPNGNLECLGRIDNQVKIRGYRIELGEIEAKVNQLTTIKENCVVIKKDGLGFKYLVNYYVPDWQLLYNQEAILYQKQIENWKEIYEDAYQQSTTEEVEFDIGIWKDSFTGTAIPEVEMRAWLADIVAIIKQGKPSRVLEVGIGTGLFYYQIAPYVKQYIGTDISATCIEQIQTQIANKPLFPETILKVAAADAVQLDRATKVDTIIINSVVQYFPGIQYLSDIIKSYLPLIDAKGGRIIIGDVRHRDLLTLLKTRLALKNLADNESLETLRWEVEKEVLREKELCISPWYFYNLREKFPAISQIEIVLKEGEYLNEMSLYRYNVILYVGHEKTVSSPKWIDWKALEAKELIATNIEQKHRHIAIANLPNPKLKGEIAMQEILTQQKPATVKDFKEAMTKLVELPSFQHIEELLEKAESMGYRCRRLLHADALKMNIWLTLNSEATIIQPTFPATDNLNTSAISNFPLFQEATFELEQSVKVQLQSALPSYMLPAKFIAVKQIPLTPNGKTNRQFLSEDEEGQRRSANYQSANTPTERKLLAIWEELLQLTPIGTADNFFELGGHSLTATRLVATIRKEMEVDVAIKDIFTKPTIISLAKFIETAGKTNHLPVLVPQKRPAKIPLSFAQERLWFLDKLQGSINYHLPAVFNVEGNFNKHILGIVLKEIIGRHEVLRTIYKEENGKPYQFVLSNDVWLLEEVTLNESSKAKVAQYIQEEVTRPFDLAKDYMLRAKWVKTSDEKQLLIVVMHHIASDGWSLPLIIKELVALYRSKINRTLTLLPKLDIQYADYAIWQRQFLTASILDKQLAYWKQQLSGLNPLNLSTDYPRPIIQSIKGRRQSFTIAQPIKEYLEQFAKEEGVTLFMVLLTAFKVFLYRYTNQQDICVGTPIANRAQKEAESLIGFFVNTLAIRSTLKSTQQFKEILKKVKETILDAHANQDIPFEQVVNHLDLKRDTSRSPLFQVMFVFQNNPNIAQYELDDGNFSAVSFEERTTKFDLTFNLYEQKDTLSLSIEYCVDLYNPNTIDLSLIHI